jgi:hypothetical protein
LWRRARHRGGVGTRRQRAGVEAAGGRKRRRGKRAADDVEVEGDAAVVGIGDGEVGGRVGNSIDQAVCT